MKKKQKTIYLDVTVKRIYGFEERMINGWSTEEVIDDWFNRYDINFPHATRDSHHFGNIDTVIDIKEVVPSEFEPRVNKYFGEIAEAKRLARVDMLKELGMTEKTFEKIYGKS